jgi:histidine phosphotransferase ChpT
VGAAIVAGRSADVTDVISDAGAANGGWQMSWQEIDRFSLGSVLSEVADQVPEAPPPPGVAGHLDLRVLELLTARLCHELIGPIAAINNGVELLADELVPARGQADPDFMHDAIAIVGDSASRAAGRLQFYRFAYGYGRGGSMVGSPPNELASRFFERTPITCEYGASVRALPLDWQRLACNLLLAGAEALSRGGSLVLAFAPDGLVLEATGECAALPPETSAALSPATPVAELTPRSVQAYFTGLLAETLGCRLVRMEELRRLRLTAVALGD